MTKDLAQRRRLILQAVFALLLWGSSFYNGSGSDGDVVPHRRRPEEGKIELPFYYTLLFGAIGYTTTGLAPKFSQANSPWIDHRTVEYLFRRVPLYQRGPDIPRVGWEMSPLNHGLQNWPDSEFKKRLRLSRPTCLFDDSSASS